MIVHRERIRDSGVRCDGGEGAGEDRLALACPLQCPPAVADLRLLPYHGGVRCRNRRVLCAVPGSSRGLRARRPRLFHGTGDRPCRVVRRPGHGACQHWLAGLLGPGRQAFRPARGRSSLDRAGASRAWRVATAGASAPVQGRLCAVRKSDTAIGLAHKKLRRKASKSGKKLKSETLEYAKYVILFTTFPESDFPPGAVLEWYRVRWQVELVFKRFKSITKLGHLPKHDDESAKAWLYGKLFTALFVEKLIRHASAGGAGRKNRTHSPWRTSNSPSIRSPGPLNRTSRWPRELGLDLRYPVGTASQENAAGRTLLQQASSNKPYGVQPPRQGVSPPPGDRASRRRRRCGWRCPRRGPWA